MIVEKRISLLRLFRVIWRELIGIVVVSAVPVLAMIVFDLEHYAINTSIPLVYGTAIAIFLGFRTNSAYERWWEARRLWGGVIVDSRSLARLCKQFLQPGDGDESSAVDPMVRQIIQRQIAWAWVLGGQLKNVEATNQLETWLSESEVSQVRGAHDGALLVLDLQSQSLRQAMQGGRLGERQWVLIEETLSRLNEYYGGCQRIKNTPFPAHYTFFTRIFIWLFVALLAFSLAAAEHAGLTLIPAVFLVGWMFFMVEGIGSYMQDPFELNRNVIPMDAMSRVIERDLLATLGQTDLPEMIQPVDGALY